MRLFKRNNKILDMQIEDADGNKRKLKEFMTGFYRKSNQSFEYRVAHLYKENEESLLDLTKHVREMTDIEELKQYKKCLREYNVACMNGLDHVEERRKDGAKIDSTLLIFGSAYVGTMSLGVGVFTGDFATSLAVLLGGFGTSGLLGLAFGMDYDIPLPQAGAFLDERKLNAGAYCSEILANVVSHRVEQLEKENLKDNEVSRNY